MLKFGPEGFGGVECRRLLDQDQGEVREDAPVALLIGIGQGAAGGGLANATVIKLGAQSPETGFDVAQALPLSQLDEGQHEEMLVGGQCAHMFVARVAADTLVEGALGQLVHQLGEDGSALIHSWWLPRKRGQPHCETAFHK